MEIKDRVAIITGGGGGIGSAVARRWMAEGARAVVVADRNGDAARKVGAEIGCLGVELDVTDEAAVVALVERVENEIGPIDIFFSNAGAGAGGGVEAPNEAWQAQWELHVMAHVYAARAVLPSMTARGEGYIVQTASAAVHMSGGKCEGRCVARTRSAWRWRCSSASVEAERSIEPAPMNRCASSPRTRARPMTSSGCQSRKTAFTTSGATASSSARRSSSRR